MTLPTNDGFANYELSIEQLEAIAAGNWLGDAARWVGREAVKAWHVVDSPGGKFVLRAALDVAGIFVFGATAGNLGFKQN